MREFNLKLKWKAPKWVFLFAMLLLCTNTSKAQIDIKDFEFLARGKALSFVAIEDDWITTFSFGTEIRLYNEFSFVADLVYIRRRFETEVYNQPSGGFYIEFAQLNTRRYLAFEFRYFLPRNIPDPNLSPYFNLFTKWGNRDWRTEDNFPLEDGDLYQLFGSINDVGTSFGLTTVARPFGVDFNIGIAYRFETLNTETFQSTGPLVYEYDIDDSGVRGNMRLNFYWNFMQ